MTETISTIDSNLPVQYAFRFSSSGQLLHLTQKQIDLVPYLSVLLSYKNDFLSIENENGDYVLNLPIKYPSFVAILSSITTENPYELFDKLPKSENIFELLEIFDYLGFSSFPLPFLKNTNLIQSNSAETQDGKTKIKYHRAFLAEVHRTAGKFVLDLAKNE